MIQWLARSVKEGNDPMKFNRREFITGLTASGMSLGMSRCYPLWAASTEKILEQQVRFRAEGERLTQACMNHFWDKNSRMFRAPSLSAETVPSDELHDRGYTLWPSLVALHALIEGEKIHPGHYAPQIATVYDGIQQYWSDDLQAYTSWLHFPGNTDAYYDDNAWVVIVFVEAYLACRKSDPSNSMRYLERAKTVMSNYIVKGYGTTDNPGGMRWGTDTTKPNTSDRGTSSTAGGALAALMLARAGVDTPFYTNWGHNLLSWLATHLLDSDGLIMDALTPPNWEVRRVKWTYNTGVPMRSYVEHYRLTKNKESLAMAEKLARASINREGALFDQKVQDPGKRFYWDGAYFVHYLIDGLLQVAVTTSDTKLVRAINETIVQNANYTRDYLRDDSDGFYWRNCRLYTIGEPQHKVWEKWTGQTIAPEYDPSERSQAPIYRVLEVQNRPLVKTLLANAGAARLFWLAGQLSFSAKT